jgi:NAD(P)-dependent dehydrogenase (short-subunit alcohol dehydrogenase family)
MEGSYDAVQQHQGEIDVVFANAGGGEFAPLGAITEEHFDKTFATNVKGALFTVQKALPLMSDGGSVILTSSTTGTTGTSTASSWWRRHSHMMIGAVAGSHVRNSANTTRSINANVRFSR